jgi:hypothetical protein
VKLPAVLQFIFGCRHRHLSRVFTIKRRTYRVCFDCGREFELPDADAPMRFNSSRSETPPSGARLTIDLHRDHDHHHGHAR